MSVEADHTTCGALKVTFEGSNNWVWREVMGEGAGGKMLSGTPPEIERGRVEIEGLKIWQGGTSFS